MAGFIEGIQRSHTVLFSERLEDWIGEDDLVRVVDLFVDELDLADLGFVCSTSARTGRPVDLHRFRSGLLRAKLSSKETGYGSNTQRRVQAGCGSHCAHQRPDTASGCV